MQGLEQQLKAPEAQDSRRDLMSLESLPELTVDLLIDAEIGIIKLESKSLERFAEGGRFGTVVIEERAICIEEKPGIMSFHEV